MPLRIYDTLTQKTRDFLTQGQEAGNPADRKVKMYVCGPTVYDQAHTGHARAYVAFDIVRRWLEFSGYYVYHVENITDVDDKILNRVKEEGGDPDELAKRLTAEYLEDMDRLGIKRASFYTRVRDHIPEIHRDVLRLIEKGDAYEVKGSVYFRVGRLGDDHKLPLSKNITGALRPGARIAVDEGKEHPADFALWKKDDEWGWESPWGKGRPGWHIECSTMAAQYLGPTLDIHGGGNDLIFPHHECETMQYEALTGSKFARFWMHNGMLNVNGEKMAKSLKNYFSVRQVLTEYDPEVLRFFLAYTQYRKPIEYSTQGLEEARSALRTLRGAVGRLRGEEGKKSVDVAKFRKEFAAAMDDDFNTREAIAALYGLATAAEGAGGDSRKDALALFDDAEKVLGVSWTPRGGKDEGLMSLLLELRDAARKSKDFKTSDRIRDRLKEMGVVVEDKGGAQVWYYS